MRCVAKALKQFVGGFGLPAYAVNSVPDNVQVPYLVYPITEPEWNQKTTFYVQGWYRTNGYAEMLAKADQIIRTIGEGISIRMDSGCIVIYPETPLFQTLKEGDFRSFYINLSINAYHMPGE